MKPKKPLAKKELKNLAISKANITTRNFPETVEKLREKFKITSSSSATVYSNDFKTDWSKFVKTFEI